MFSKHAKNSKINPSHPSQASRSWSWTWWTSFSPRPHTWHGTRKLRKTHRLPTRGKSRSKTRQEILCRWEGLLSCPSSNRKTKSSGKKENLVAPHTHSLYLSIHPSIYLSEDHILNLKWSLIYRWVTKYFAIWFLGNWRWHWRSRSSKLMVSMCVRAHFTSIASSLLARQVTRCERFKK